MRRYLCFAITLLTALTIGAVGPINGLTGLTGLTGEKKLKAYGIMKRQDAINASR